METCDGRIQHPVGAMNVGETGYACASALVVDEHGDCYLRADARVQGRGDAAHPLWVVRTPRGFLVDVTDMAQDVAMVDARDTAQYMPVTQVTYGGELIRAAKGAASARAPAAE